jgi:hypothetical protein
MPPPTVHTLNEEFEWQVKTIGGVAECKSMMRKTFADAKCRGVIGSVGCGIRNGETMPRVVREDKRSLSTQLIPLMQISGTLKRFVENRMRTEGGL